jgi:pimeloyl-ACP methyl ester carboxylesterase
LARKRGAEPEQARCGAQRRLGGRLLAALASLAMLGACAGDPTARLAREHGFSVRTVVGHPYHHLVVERGTVGSGDAPLWVFLEGDGRPFTAGGTRIAPDPTPRRPLALELAARTPGAVLYLGRPCYYRLRDEPGCTPALWTDARYSEAVIDSLAAVIRAALESGQHTRVVLVGYSGGGTLATLLAPRIDAVRAVVTVAANLDVAAWASFHGYRPLTGLDPATLPAGAGGARLAHLEGGRDTVVPPSLIAGYLAGHRAVVGDFPDFDHVCCWVEAWPAILADLAPWLDGRVPLPVAGTRDPQRAFSVSTARTSGL